MARKRRHKKSKHSAKSAIKKALSTISKRLRKLS